MRAYARGDAVWKASFIAGLLTKQIWQKQELSEQREESKTSVWLYRVATEEDDINCRSSERRAKLQFGSTESRRKKMVSTMEERCRNMLPLTFGNYPTYSHGFAFSQGWTVLYVNIYSQRCQQNRPFSLGWTKTMKCCCQAAICHAACKKLNLLPFCMFLNRGVL